MLAAGAHIQLPSSLLELDITWYQERFDIVPLKRLRTLTLGRFSRVSPSDLPPSLTSLRVDSSDFNLHKIPPSVSHLTLLNECPPLNTIPSTVTHLSLPSYNKQNIPLTRGVGASCCRDQSTSTPPSTHSDLSRSPRFTPHSAHLPSTPSHFPPRPLYRQYCSQLQPILPISQGMHP